MGNVDAMLNVAKILTKANIIGFVLLIGLWVGALQFLPKEPTNYFEEVSQWMPGTETPILGLSLQPTDGFLHSYHEQYYMGKTEHYRVYVDVYDGYIEYLRVNTNLDYKIYLGDLVGVWGHPDKFYRNHGRCYADWGQVKQIIMLCRQKNGMGVYNLRNRVVLVRFFLEIVDAST